MPFDTDSFDRLTPFVAAFGPNLEEGLEEHTENVYNEMVDNWERGQDALGRSWEPNAPATLEQKQGSTPLIDTRQMIESADWEMVEDEIVSQIYIDDEPGKVLAHEYGVPDQGIPARPILGPTGRLFEKEADGVVKTAVDRSLGGGFL